MPQLFLKLNKGGGKELKKWTPYLLILPALALRFSTSIYPVIHTFYLSLCKMDLIAQERGFIGLMNYVKLFHDNVTVASINFTFIFTFISAGLQILIGFGFAVLFNQKIKGVGMIRAINLLPWAMPLIVAGITARWMFNDQFGVINDILFRIGIIKANHVWLADEFSAKMVTIAIDVWKNTPFVILVFLAGLQALPVSLYEAAEIDGASVIQKFFYITLPLMKVLIHMMIIFTLLWRLIAFDIIYGLTQGGPARATEVLSLRVYIEAFKLTRFGYSSAIAIVLFIICLVITLFYIRLLRKEI